MAAGRLARGRPPGLNKRATMLLPQHLYYLGAGDEPWLDLMDNDEVADPPDHDRGDPRFARPQENRERES